MYVLNALNLQLVTRRQTNASSVTGGTQEVLVQSHADEAVVKDLVQNFLCILQKK